MPMSDDPGFVDATTQAEMVRNGEVTPLELVDSAIERVERLNPALNAVITPMYDEAREAASRPIPDGPFSGVPFLAKDFLAEYAGVRFTESSNYIGDFVPEEDTELVRRWKRAGLIAIGKTNLPEMAIGATTEPVRFGPTRNPWDTTRTPGGSSGGAGAAVASGMVPMAHGNDAGGSIRIPAACCGVFGLKPTRGRNPLGPHFGDMLSGFVAEHALTRTVRDSAALLDATAGPAVGDPYWAPPQRRPYVEEVSTDPGRLRVAFSKSTLLGNPLHPDCTEAVLNTASLCDSLGHEVSRGDAVSRLGDSVDDLHDRHGDGVRLGGGRLDSTAGTRASRRRSGAVRRRLRGEGSARERPGVPPARPGDTQPFTRHRRVLRELRRVADANSRRTAGDPRNSGLRRRRPD